MITVVIQQDGKPLGEMRLIELDSLPGVSPLLKDFEVEYAVESGGDWVDLKRSMLYGFDFTKYNAMALVRMALELFDYEDMELTDAEGGSASMAWGFNGVGEEVPRKKGNPKPHHRPALWRRQPK